MKRNEFIEKYKINEEHEEWFLSERAFTNDLKVMGWKIITPKLLHEYNPIFNESDITCTNPNFYKDGDIIGNSRKSEIMASGMFKIKYNGKEYTNMYLFIKEEGIEALSDLENIQWDESMDWIIVNKKQGTLKAQFDDWDECPQRKEVEK